MNLRHNLSHDVRMDLYKAVNDWIINVKEKGGEFNGGKEPDLADIVILNCSKFLGFSPKIFKYF